MYHLNICSINAHANFSLNCLVKVAVKILEKEKINDQKDVERITREIKILKKVRHPNVIQLYEVSN